MYIYHSVGKLHFFISIYCSWIENFHICSYVHGSPLLESSKAFESQEAAKRTAAALGRVLVLDLVIRNEDRLPCHQLRWRGNSANLLLAEKIPAANMDALVVAFDSAIKRYGPKVMQALEKERRSTSVESTLGAPSPVLMSQQSDVSDIMESPNAARDRESKTSNESTSFDFHVVAIDSGVPRRPPAGKRTNDHESYPKLVELLINSSMYASNVLYEVTGGKLGSPSEDTGMMTDSNLSDMTSIVHGFRSGFRAGVRDLQGFHIFLLTLNQKLDGLLRIFLNIIHRSTGGDMDREDTMNPQSPCQSSGGNIHFPSPPSKERNTENYSDILCMADSQCLAHRVPTCGRDSLDSSSPHSRDTWQGKSNRGIGEALHSLRMTSKLRDFNKFAKVCVVSSDVIFLAIAGYLLEATISQKTYYFFLIQVDAELNKEMEQWNEMLKNDAVKLCQESNFYTGFFEGSDTNSVVDAYELKV